MIRMDKFMDQKGLKLPALFALVCWAIHATWPRGYKTFFMLNSVEHEILNAHTYKKYQEIWLFTGSDKPGMLFFLLTDVKMPTIVGILTFMSRKNFMFSWIEHNFFL